MISIGYLTCIDLDLASDKSNGDGLVTCHATGVDLQVGIGVEKLDVVQNISWTQTLTFAQADDGWA